jgi:hypothetical protein
METNTVHYRIHVYGPESRPPDEPIATTLCPAARQDAHAALAIEVAQVTCRRCLQLLDVIGLRPIL